MPLHGIRKRQLTPALAPCMVGISGGGGS
jgi:hypothetical protein